MKKCFTFNIFATKEKAEAYAKEIHKRKYTISETTDKSGWILAYYQWN